MKARMLVSAAALVIGGCVQLDGSDGREWVERTYRTGSNIPSKHSPEAEGVAVMNRDSADAWRSQMPPGIPCSANLGCPGAKH